MPDLRRWLKPGDAIWLGQGCAEPLALSRALVQQRDALAGCRVFLGMLLSNTFEQSNGCSPLELHSYGGVGRNSWLIDNDALQVTPCNYSSMPRLIEDGVLPCDAVLIQLSAEGPDGNPSLGIAHDYLIPALRRARVVIAEINEQMPWTPGSQPLLSEIRFDAVVRTSRPLLELPPPCWGDRERRIASQVACHVADRATLEIGIGSLSDAILQAVSDRRDLGIHSGLLGDGIVSLMERGVITNAFKTIGRGRTTGGLLFGSHRTIDFARLQSRIELRGPEYTHALHVLAQLDGFTAINSAIQIDLTGQVNAEVVDGRYVGAVGGLADFVRGAGLARGGRSIIALPSTTSGTGSSRIVPALTAGTVTVSRNDADLVVTEWGTAELRGQPLSERARRLIAIAHPDHREQLARAWQGRNPW